MYIIYESILSSNTSDNNHSSSKEIKIVEIVDIHILDIGIILFALEYILNTHKEFYHLVFVCKS